MSAETLNGVLASLHDRLHAAEQIFFSWLLRVFAAATLAGTAWIDDAPPLDLAAMLISAYVALRVITEFGRFKAAAPFQTPVLKNLFAVLALVLLGLSFLAVYTFTERIALLVA